MRPLLHMVCGGVGAGKTTHARKLADEIGGLRFSIDEWMTGLFGPDSPQPPQWGWVVERVRRCETRIVAQALDAARRGVPSVLDLSFLRRDDRRRLAEQADAAGVGVALHFLDVPVDERWRRVAARNALQGETFSLVVPRPIFDFVESMFEPPGEDELANHPVIPTEASRSEA